jgi:hypothetical protein
LYVMRWLIGSQCSSFIAGVMWSRDHKLATRRAAAFCAR